MVIPTPPQRMFPKCPKCGSQNFASQANTFKKVPVLIIYCESCGTAIGAVNQSTNKK